MKRALGKLLLCYSRFAGKILTDAPLRGAPRRLGPALIRTRREQEPSRSYLRCILQWKCAPQELQPVTEARQTDVVIRKFTGLEPNAQGKLLLSFVPVEGYATVTGIEVLPQ